MLMFLGAAGPVNNILVVKQEIDPSNHMSSTVQASSRKKGAYLSPPLEKYTNSTDEDSYIKVSLRGGATDVKYLSSEMISKYDKELQV